MKTGKGKQPKALYRTIHLWLGLISGLVVFIVSVTGALYVFEEEGRELFQDKYYHTAHVTTTRLPLDQLRDSVAAHFPKEKISSIRFKGDADATYIFYTADRLISVDPATGAVLGVRNKDRDFFTVVQKIHTELYLGDVGKEVIKWNVLVFFIMCLTGLILWIPRKLKNLKQAIRPNLKTKNRKLLTWNLHTVFGFYALPILLLLSLTGLFFAFDAAKSLVAWTTTGKATVKERKYKVKPIPVPTRVSLQEAYNYSTSSGTALPVESIVRLPDKKNAVVRIDIRYPYQVMRHQNTFYFNANDGRLLGEMRYSKYTAYDKVAMSNYNLHTGRIGPLGIGSKILYFLAALISASLPVTGFLMWWGKQRKKKPARKVAVPHSLQLEEC